MKRLLIAAMIAILIGTMQAVKIKSQAAILPTMPNPDKPCTLAEAKLSWYDGFFSGWKRVSVAWYIS